APAGAPVASWRGDTLSVTAPGGAMTFRAGDATLGTITDRVPTSGRAGNATLDLAGLAAPVSARPQGASARVFAAQSVDTQGVHVTRSFSALEGTRHADARTTLDAHAGTTLSLVTSDDLAPPANAWVAYAVGEG